MSLFYVTLNILILNVTELVKKAYKNVWIKKKFYNIQ